MVMTLLISLLGFGLLALLGIITTSLYPTLEPIVKKYLAKRRFLKEEARYVSKEQTRTDRYVAEHPYVSREAASFVVEQRHYEDGGEIVEKLPYYHNR